MDSTKIRAIIIAVLALFVALYLGIAAATAQIEAILWVLGTVFLAVCILLGKNIWILIPATLSMKGGINALPGMIPPWVFMTMVAGGFFLMRLAIRKQPLRIRWTGMETVLLLVGLTILQAMIRNPVGLRAMGGDTAGGKPYFIFAFAFAAYLTIIMSNPSPKEWRWAVILFITFGILDGLIQALSAVFPGFAQIAVRIYSNVSFDEAMGQGAGYELSERRFGFLAQIGSIMGLVACSYWRPMAAIDLTKPWRALTAGLAIVCTLLSGFRSGAASLFLRFAVGSAIRRKYVDVVVVVIIGMLLIAALVVTDSARSLPFGVQRVLTVLPISINLDGRAESQAYHSADDRFEMWRLALGTERYIQNKFLGDGFQFSAVEINAMAESRLESSRLDSVSFVERSLEVGNYHGFHVETIRFTGVVGLLAATIALLVFARFAWKTIQFHRGSQEWGHVIFVCMPFLIHPFYYWLIFGSYRADYPGLIVMAAMVKVAYMFGFQAQPHSPLQQIADSKPPLGAPRAGLPEKQVVSL